MRKSGHFNKLARPVGFFVCTIPQYLGTNHGVFAIHFVKVSYTEQKYSIRMFRLYIEILLHQWGFQRSLPRDISFIILFTTAQRYKFL